MVFRTAPKVDKDAVKKATLTSGFFASKNLGLNLNPMEARSRYGMRDEQEKTFMLQKGPLGEDRLRVCTESSKHGRMFICFVALILGHTSGISETPSRNLPKRPRQWRQSLRKCRPYVA